VARILTVCPITGKVLTITTVVRKRLQMFVTEITAVHMDMFGNIVIRTYIAFRFVEIEIHLDIVECFDLFSVEHLMLLG
jgi:hypothetical protein